ncbi:MAG: OmpA family protein [Polyangiales bacterium]
MLGLLVVGASMSACGHGEQEWQGKLREITTLQGQLREMTSERDHLREQIESLRASNEAMARRLSELGENVNRLQADQARTESELTAAQAREAELRRRQQQQEARMATYRNMLAQFRSMISAGQLRVRAVRGRLVIELPAGILFDSGRAELRREGQDVLRQVATVLSQISGRDFLVAGHTDNVQLGRGGRFEDNWELSAARALNVVRFLAQNNVTSAHLGAAGYAEFQPAESNDTDEHRALNRRVEIVLMPNIEELPDLSTLESPATPAPAPAR